MVLLTTTPNILRGIAALPPDSPLYVQHASSLPTTPDSPISHSSLTQLAKCLQPQNTLASLLRGTRVYTPPPPAKAEPSEEYKALMAKLRVEQERREYRAMLVQREQNSQQALNGQIGADDEHEGDDDISPSLVLNMVLSVVMCAFVAWHLTRWWPNDGVRVLVALGVAIVVGVAEVVVYAAYLRKITDSRIKERRKKESKEVLEEYVVEDVDLKSRQGDPATDAEVEKTEIWGKGVHGGMRRRVREKWEKEQERDESKKQS